MEEFWTKIEIWQVIVLMTCLLFSSFFSAAETALTSITPTKAVQLMDSGLKRASYLEYWFNHTSEIITTILIGNNATNIAASALTTLMAEKLFNNIGIAITLGAMTMYVLTFGEIIPKVFARANAVKLSLLFIPILIGFYYMFYPITKIFVFMTEKIFKSATLDGKRNPMVTLKDIDFFISLAQKEGSLKGSKKGMYLKAVSEFSELKVKNIMVPENRVAVIKSDIQVRELLDLIKEDMYTRYPVVNDNGTFIGILNVKDFLINQEKCEQENSIISILRPTLWTNEFMKVDYVLELMKLKKSQMFLVKNEYNRFSGIVTMEDILEELVGEIEDEHDEELADSKESAEIDNVFIVNGEDSVHDLNSKYNFNIPDDKDFQTLNGFVLHLFNGVLPKKETIISWENLRIKILKNKDKNIEKAEITVV